uniref:Uncharacterized protein n=1 Tax=Noccaea caerulescens TaxID=107243 RepID=A0A1J3EQZ9_NOCCA
MGFNITHSTHVNTQIFSKQFYASCSYFMFKFHSVKRLEAKLFIIRNLIAVPHSCFFCNLLRSRLRVLRLFMDADGTRFNSGTTHFEYLKTFLNNLSKSFGCL